MKPKKPVKVNLPKDALAKINLGHSFAEYDQLLTKKGVFVQTPSIDASLDPSRSKSFFVGRRGTGKTAITLYLEQNRKCSIPLHPQVFSPLGLEVDIETLRDARQRSFRSLVAAFSRALLNEVVLEWSKAHLIRLDDLPRRLKRERNFIESMDFDLRVLQFVEDLFGSLTKTDEKGWLKHIRCVTELINEMKELAVADRWNYTLLIDRIDDSWDGSDVAVIFLTALMHSCVELTAAIPSVRPLLFLRENIFERVREIDNEFQRLETSVVSMEWSREQLVELVERRLNLPLNTKLPLRGPTWDHFFEGDGDDTRSLVFDYCQKRPRDVLTYCSFAVESAQSHKRQKVTIEDVLSARRRFSDSRLKDLGDEYAENYPQIQLVLSRFYGLGGEYTLLGIDSFVKKLLVDEQINQCCNTWLYEYTQPERFMQLMYNIGFFGFRSGDSVLFRALGPRSTTPPAITTGTHAVVHPCYTEALNLQDVLIDTLDASVELQKSGLIMDLPGAIKLDEYHNRLQELQADLKSLPCGWDNASRFEDIVGDIIRLCFFRSLVNVEEKSRDVEGRVVRDWIAANRARSGFWELIRMRYRATQVVWECKNFEDLDSRAFQQASYYMTKEIGHFAVLCFRGTEKEKHYYQHVKRIANEKDGGIVLLLNDKDLQVFLRQAIKGKITEDHIHDQYDITTRAIS